MTTSCSRASRTISATGLIVPTTLETCATASSLAPGSSRESASRSSRPSPSSGTSTSSAPVARASIHHGTKLEWCSIRVTRILSPAPTCRAPQPCATTFSASVALRVKTVSRAAQFSARATRVRAPSNRSVASAASG